MKVMVGWWEGGMLQGQWLKLRLVISWQMMVQVMNMSQLKMRMQLFYQRLWECYFLQQMWRNRNMVEKVRKDQMVWEMVGLLLGMGYFGGRRLRVLRLQYLVEEEFGGLVEGLGVVCCGRRNCGMKFWEIIVKSLGLKD